MIDIARKSISLITLVLGPVLIVSGIVYTNDIMLAMGLIACGWRAVSLLIQSLLMYSHQRRMGVSISFFHLFRSLIVETFWVYYVFFVEQSWLHQRKFLHYRGNHKKTVVLIHGFAGRSSCWNTFCSRLEKKGVSYYRVDLSNTNISIDQHADTILKTIELASRVSGGCVNVIAHSMGGLALRSAIAQNPILEHFIDQCVYLGTPHYGTRLAVIALSRSAEQMQPTSEWLTRLPLTSLELRKRSFSYRSLVDNVVFPSCNSHLSATTSREYNDIGHVEFLQSQRVFDDISNDLQL